MSQISKADEVRGSSGLDGKRVLIVEDEVIICLDLRTALEAAGAQVSVARKPERALEVIAEGAPDAAVLDVNLGGGDTCAPVAEKLIEIGVPFVLHSGDLDRQGELVSSIDAKVIQKPAPGDLVAEEVAALLS